MWPKQLAAKTGDAFILLIESSKHIWICFGLGFAVSFSFACRQTPRLPSAFESVQAFSISFFFPKENQPKQIKFVSAATNRNFFLLFLLLLLLAVLSGFRLEIHKETWNRQTDGSAIYEMQKVMTLLSYSQFPVQPQLQ